MSRNEKLSLLGIWILPLLPAMVVGYGFHGDWYVHLWMIKYQGAYFANNLAWPLTYSTKTVVGMPTPMFYAHGLYKLIGLTASLVGGSIALRLWIVLVSGMSTLLVYFACLQSGFKGKSALGITALLLWSIYTWTCLYNRGALAEFFGIHFVIWIVCLAFLAAWNEPNRSSLLFVGFAVAALLWGTHTLSAALGFVFSAFIAMLLFFNSRGPWNWQRILSGAALVLGTNAAWLYLYLKYGSSLEIVRSSQRMELYKDTIDAWWIRWLPFPVDVRMFGVTDIFSVATPFMTAPFNSLLLIALVVGIIITGKKLTWPVWCLLSMAGALYLLSVVEDAWTYLPNSLGVIQFAYRLVTFITLSIFAAILFWRRQQNSVPPIFSRVVMGLVLVSATGLAAKTYQAWQMMEPLENKQDFDYIFESFGGNTDYALKYFYPSINGDPKGWDNYRKMFLLPSFQWDFGRVEPFSFNANNEVTIGTNVVTFPFNVLTLDNKFPDLYATPLQQFAFKAQPGMHVLQYFLMPSSMYVWLNTISTTFLFVALGIVLFGLFKICREKLR